MTLSDIFQKFQIAQIWGGGLKGGQDFNSVKKFGEITFNKFDYITALTALSPFSN